MLVVTSEKMEYRGAAFQKRATVTPPLSLRKTPKLDFVSIDRAPPT